MIQKQGNKFYYLVPNFGMSLVKHTHVFEDVSTAESLVEGSHYDMIYCTSLHRRMLMTPSRQSEHSSFEHLFACSQYTLMRLTAAAGTMQKLSGPGDDARIP